MPFYSVANGRIPGIYTTWEECKQQTALFNNARYKKFETKEEAQQYIDTYTTNKEKKEKREQKMMEGSQHKINKIINIHDETKTYHHYVYTDGACMHNGKKNAKAGYGVYFGEGDSRNLSCIVSGTTHTNNVAELMAIIKGLETIIATIAETETVALVTDSEYCIRCLTTYGQGQEKKEWSQDIPNRDLVRRVYELYKGAPNVQVYHIDAHTSKEDDHSRANDEVDKLANKAIGLEGCPYEEKRQNIANETKIYLFVPYEKKDDAKAKGAKWDNKKKLWYVTIQTPGRDELETLYGLKK